MPRSLAQNIPITLYLRRAYGSVHTTTKRVTFPYPFKTTPEVSIDIRRRPSGSTLEWRAEADKKGANIQLGPNQEGEYQFDVIATGMVSNLHWHHALQKDTPNRLVVFFLAYMPLIQGLVVTMTAVATFIFRAMIENWMDILRGMPS